jgi:hypothetical protein
MTTKATDLEGKRAALDSKLQTLRMSPVAADLVRKADAAVSQYRAEASELEQQIAEIDAHLGVREQDRRTAAAKAREQQWRDQRQALVAEQDVLLAAVADAEAATRALVDALDRTFASNARMARIARDLSTTHKVPLGLSGTDLVSRMAGRLASVMKTVKGHPHRLGTALEWRGASLYQPDTCWRDDEEKKLAAGVIQPLLVDGKAA